MGRAAQTLIFIIVLSLAGCSSQEKPDLSNEDKPAADLTEESVDTHNSVKEDTKPVTRDSLDHSEQTRLLTQALNEDRFDKIMELVKGGADVNTKLSYAGRKPAPLLLFALAAEQKELAKQIIETEGCDLNVKHLDGTSPLLLAEFLEYQDIVDLLIEKGATPLKPMEKLVVQKMDFPWNAVGTVLVRFQESKTFGEGFIVHPELRNFRVLTQNERNLGEYLDESSLFSYGRIRSAKFSPDEKFSRPGFTILSLCKLPTCMNETIFSVWETQEDGSFKFATNLNRDCSEYYGGPQIRNIYSLSESQALLAGICSGGDAGETWGYFWIGLWGKPNKFQILHKMTFGDNENESTNYSFSFDLETLSMDITETKTKYSDSENPDTGNTETNEKRSRKDYRIELKDVLAQNGIYTKPRNVDLEKARALPDLHNSDIIVKENDAQKIFATVITRELGDGNLQVDPHPKSLEITENTQKVYQDFYRKQQDHFLGQGYYLSHLLSSSHKYQLENQMLIPLHSVSFEGGEQVFTIWDVDEKGGLTLHSVLERGIRCSFGKAEISEVIKLNHQEKLIIGTTRGADGGDSWGSWWIGLWAGKNKFRILKRLDSYIAFNEALNENNWEDFDFECEIENNKIVAVKERKLEMYQAPDGSRKTNVLDEKVHKVDLAPLIETARKEMAGN